MHECISMQKSWCVYIVQDQDERFCSWGGYWDCLRGPSQKYEYTTVLYMYLTLKILVHVDVPVMLLLLTCRPDMKIPLLFTQI